MTDDREVFGVSWVRNNQTTHLDINAVKFYSVIDTNGINSGTPSTPCSITITPNMLVNELWRDVIDPADDRHLLWIEQRATRGFDDTDLWSLDQTIARFLVSRLKAFRDHHGSIANVPHSVRAKLEDAIVAFETIIERGDGCLIDEDDQILIKKGFKSLRQIFFKLFI